MPHTTAQEPVPAPSPAGELREITDALQAAAQTEALVQQATQDIARQQTLVGVPRTAREMRALRARRTELSNQLTSAQERRSELAREIRRTDAEARGGMEGRLKVLDARIMQLEADIASTGRMVVAAPAELLTSSSEPPRFDPNRVEVEPIAIVFTLAVFMPIALAYARMIWKRTTRAVFAPPAPSREDSERLHRLEQSVDAIAVEVERISEGQRFVTQLMAEQASAARARGRRRRSAPGLTRPGGRLPETAPRRVP